MPQNPSTGKTDRRALSDAEILQYRRKQVEKSQAPDAGESEGSGLSPSPLATLSGLGRLTLDSGSSAADTPADSPAAGLSHPPLPERPAPPLPSVPKTRKASKRPGKSGSKHLF